MKKIIMTICLMLVFVGGMFVSGCDDYRDKTTKAPEFKDLHKDLHKEFINKASRITGEVDNKHFNINGKEILLLSFHNNSNDKLISLHFRSGDTYIDIKNLEREKGPYFEVGLYNVSGVKAGFDGTDISEDEIEVDAVKLSFLVLDEIYLKYPQGEVEKAPEMMKCLESARKDLSLEETQKVSEANDPNVHDLRKGPAVISLENGMAIRVSSGNQKQDFTPYDYENDPNIPQELKQKISILITALDTNNLDLYWADYDIESYYDLLTGKVSLCDLPDNYTDMGLRDLREKQERFASENIKSLDDFKKLLIEKKDSKLFEEIRSSKKYCISSVEVNDKKDFVETLFNIEGTNWGVKVEWVYFKNKWWHGMEW